MMKTVELTDIQIQTLGTFFTSYKSYLISAFRAQRSTAPEKDAQDLIFAVCGGHPDIPAMDDGNKEDVPPPAPPISPEPAVDAQSDSEEEIPVDLESTETDPE